MQENCCSHNDIQSLFLLIFQMRQKSINTNIHRLEPVYLNICYDWKSLEIQCIYMQLSRIIGFLANPISGTNKLTKTCVIIYKNESEFCNEAYFSREYNLYMICKWNKCSIYIIRSVLLFKQQSIDLFSRNFFFRFKRFWCLE